MSVGSDWSPTNSIDRRQVSPNRDSFTPIPPTPSIAFYPLKDEDLVRGEQRVNNPRDDPRPRTSSKTQMKLQALEERVTVAEKSNQALLAEVN